MLLRYAAEHGYTVQEVYIDEDYSGADRRRPAASARNVTVSFQSYIANVASSEVYPTWVGHAVYSAPLPRRASRACTAAKSARETSPSWVPGTTIHCDRGSRTLRADL